VEIPYIRGSEPAPGQPCGLLEAPADNVMDWVRGWLN
jgi:penicillin-binding protein 1B